MTTSKCAVGSRVYARICWTIWAAIKGVKNGALKSYGNYPFFVEVDGCPKKWETMNENSLEFRLELSNRIGNLRLQSIKEWYDQRPI